MLSAYICLRCQLRLARPAPVSLRSLPASHARFSSSSRFRHVTTEDTPIEQPKEAKERTKRIPSPLWHIRKRAINKVPVHEESAPLGVKLLGSDAEIIVLRERVKAQRPDNAEATDLDNEESTNGTQVGIYQAQQVASLAEDDTPLTQEDINKKIETLRPEPLSGLDEPNYLTQSEFITLNRRLYSGFTAQQLSRYLSATTGVRSQRMRQEVLQGLIKDSEKSRTPSNQTEWRPGVTPLTSRLPSIERMQKQKTALSKIQLADQIIRSAWNVVLMEEIETTGELEIQLKRWQLSILNSGDAPTPLDRIQQHRNVKVEIYWPKLILRITADKSSADYAAEDIWRSLSEIYSETFDFAPWIPHLSPRNTPVKRIAQVLSQEDFETVESLSGTAIQSININTVVIRGATQVQVEDAKRYLIALLPLKPNFSRSIRSTIRKEDHSKMYMRPSLFTESLPYSFRKLKLGRWSLPVENRTSTLAGPVTSLTDVEPLPETVPLKYGGAVTAKLQSGIKNRVVKELLRSGGILATETASAETPAIGTETAEPETVTSEMETVEVEAPDTEVLDEKSCWSPKPVFEVAAEFGQALLPLNQSFATTIRDENLPCVFTGVIPGLPKFLLDLKWAQPDFTTTSQTLAYQFIPSPKNHNRKTPETYPNLTVLVELSPSGQVHVKGVGLSIEELLVDVLIPDWATDIRYKRSQKVWLQNPERDENLGGFFEAIRANIISGERLTAPPTLQLQIPGWTVKGSKKREKAGVCEAEYVFTGIEHQQTAEIDFEGRDLRYSGQQGGKLAGKEGMLELYYGPISDNRDNEWTSLSRFFESTFRISRRINDAASNTRPLEKMYKRRMEGEQRAHQQSTAHVKEDAAHERLDFHDDGEMSADAWESSEANVEEQRAEDEDESELDNPFVANLMKQDVEADEHVKKQESST